AGGALRFLDCLPDVSVGSLQLGKGFGLAYDFFRFLGRPQYSLLTIGACNVSDPQQASSCELKPTTNNADPKALELTGLSLGRLERDGLEPAIGMQKFRDWVASTAGADGTPVFVGFNAAFDWSFVNSTLSDSSTR
ncbi:MAG: hypothetical protein WAS49_07230, partial [Candidatus Dechloromonas phosphoritropha]